MTIKFHGPGETKQTGQSFLPGIALAFDDPQAEDFFVAAGWAETTKETPIFTYPEGTVEIDPETVHASTGVKVLEG